MAVKLSKRAKANAELIPQSAMPAKEAIAALKKYKMPKFDQTVNIVFHLGSTRRTPTRASVAPCRCPAASA